MTEEESSYYNNIFNLLDKQNLGYIDSKSAAIFMKKSNLSQEILKNIWYNSSQSKKNGLTRDEFFISLRLIALAQNNLPFTKKEIENNNPIPPLPSFATFNHNNSINYNRDNNINNKFEEENGDDESVYEIPEYNAILYKKFFENNKDSKENYISTKKAIELWKSDTSSDFTIKKVANSLKPLEKTGYLNLKEFQVANHLLSICNCHEIPIPLPNCLLKFLGRPLNTNKQKQRKNNYYKNFNDYLNKNSDNINNINNNNQYMLNNDYSMENNYNKEYDKQNSLPNTNFNNRISDSNEIEIQKFKSEENEITKNINDNDDNTINRGENHENNILVNEVNEFNKDINNKNKESNNLNNIDEINDECKNNNDKSDKILENNESEMNNNSKQHKFKSSINSFNINIKNNKINNNNDIILENILKRMEELEIKNKENNTQIFLLLSKIDSLQKEQNKINKEMIELKDQFKKIKSQNNTFKPQKNKIVKNNNNSLSISLNDVFSEEIKKEKDNFLAIANCPTEKPNQALNNGFQRLQKKINIKRNNRNDKKINYSNTCSKNKNNTININDNIVQNKNNLKKKPMTSKNIPLDALETYPQNASDNNDN